MKKLMVMLVVCLFVVAVGCGGSGSASAKSDGTADTTAAKAEKTEAKDLCKNCGKEDCTGECKGNNKKGECTGACKDDCTHPDKKVTAVKTAVTEKTAEKTEEKPTVEKKAEPAAAADQGDGTLENPVKIVYSSEAVTVDGDLKEWGNIEFLPAPFAKKAESMVKLSWREDGLYGAAVIKDDSIEVDDMNPWGADCLEFWLEKDNKKADFESENAAQYVFAPAADGKNEDKATVVIPWGGFNDFPENVKCAWKKSDDGYVLEFMIPEKLMKPAKMTADTKLGMNFSVDNGGSPQQQFFCDKDEDAAYHIPQKWGTVVLTK